MAQIDTVIGDIRCFLDNSKDNLFMNERGLQMHLAIYLLNSNHYDKVEVEYYVPKNTLDNDYVWDNEMKVDIVVMKSGEYIPIELKYKTREIPSITIFRFGEELNNVQIVKNQSAQNEAKYAFWKDVRRIELLKQRFKAVSGGVALFLTNEDSYQIPPRAGAKSASHSIAEGFHPKGRDALKKEMPAFSLDNEYTIEWSGALDKGKPYLFQYVLLKV